MKIIFLDIDGVLNSQNYVLQIQELFDDPHNQMDPVAIDRLNYLTNQTGASIVVTSTWRISFRDAPEGIDIGIANCLKEHGVTGKVIGATIITDGDRADEIWDWLNNHPEIKQYVILDDDRLEMKRDNSDPILDLHFVQTAWLDGLQDKHVERAIEILNKIQ
jgi:hypothetical protein